MYKKVIKRETKWYIGPGTGLGHKGSCDAGPVWPPWGKFRSQSPKLPILSSEVYGNPNRDAQGPISEELRALA